MLRLIHRPPAHLGLRQGGIPGSCLAAHSRRCRPGEDRNPAGLWRAATVLEPFGRLLPLLGVEAAMAAGSRSTFRTLLAVFGGPRCRDSGSTSVRGSRKPRTDGECHADVAPGPHVMIAVSDIGIRMTAEPRARLCDPFYPMTET